MRKILMSAICAVLPCLCAFADGDKFESYSRLLSPEKLYLQTDREVYCLGDTIWFKGYLKDASDISEYRECNYIYVELSSTRFKKSLYNRKLEFEPQDMLVDRIKVKRTDDSFTGYIVVGEMCNTGLAILRAYSYWMLNGDPAYMFNKTLLIQNPMKDEYVKDLIEADFRDDNLYSEVGVPNPFRKPLVKPKPKDETKLDIRFLPESGRYLFDRKSVMAVKVINSQGMGVKVRGVVKNGGRNIATFETNDIGMGRFDITVPSGTTAIDCEIETENENFLYDATLPLPEDRAVTINVRTDTEGVSLSFDDKGITFPDSTFIVLHDRTEVFFKLPYTDGNRRLRFGYDLLSEGINNAAVVDASGNVYAERCFFVFPKNKVRATVSYDKEKYGKREKVRASVCVTDAGGKPVDGDFSLAVTDDKWAPYSGENHNMLSYMLLGSELSGLVEKPQRYFSDSLGFERRVADVDLLMMTQGWNYYDLPTILQGRNKMPEYGKEYTQSLSGYVNALIGKAKRSTVFFVAPSIDFRLIGDLDSSAYFALNELDFPDSTQFLVGAQGQRKIFKKLYTPILYGDKFAGEYKYPAYLKAAGYSDEYGDYATRSYYSSGGEVMYMLQPARKVAAPSMLSPYPNDNFKNDHIRTEEQFIPYESYDLYSYLCETIPGVHRGFDGFMPVYGHTMVGSSMKMEHTEKTLEYFVNGMHIWSMNEVEGLYMSDVVALAWVEGLDASRYAYDFDGMVNPKLTVFIKTRWPTRAPGNITVSRPVGWQKPARRYEPAYTTAKSKTDFEPMRATLHWEPLLKVENGRGEFEFWTSDSDSPYTVILEGLTSAKSNVSCLSTFEKR